MHNTIIATPLLRLNNSLSEARRIGPCKASSPISLFCRSTPPPLDSAFDRGRIGGGRMMFSPPSPPPTPPPSAHILPRPPPPPNVPALSVCVPRRRRNERLTATEEEKLLDLTFFNKKISFMSLSKPPIFCERCLTST